jgi:hypothetical protein
MRTILLPYTPAAAVHRLLHDVRAMVRHLVTRNLVAAHRSAIALRKETAEWFTRSWRTRYAAHYHDSPAPWQLPSAAPTGG